MNTDAVHNVDDELVVRMGAVCRDPSTTFTAKAEAIARAAVFGDAMVARERGDLAQTMAALRRDKELPGVFREVDIMLGIRSRWWWCGAPMGDDVYDAFSDDDLMRALQIAILK